MRWTAFAKFVLNELLLAPTLLLFHQRMLMLNKLLQLKGTAIELMINLWLLTFCWKAISFLTSYACKSFNKIELDFFKQKKKVCSLLLTTIYCFVFTLVRHKIAKHIFVEIKKFFAQLSCRPAYHVSTLTQLSKGFSSINYKQQQLINDTK